MLSGVDRDFRGQFLSIRGSPLLPSCSEPMISYSTPPKKLVPSSLSTSFFICHFWVREERERGEQGKREKIKSCYLLLLCCNASISCSFFSLRKGLLLFLVRAPLPSRTLTRRTRSLPCPIFVCHRQPPNGSAVQMGGSGESRIGDYEIARAIGRGKFAVVYR